MEISAHGQVAVERLAVVVAEAEVDVAQGGLVANLHGIDKAGIIQAPAVLVVGEGVALVVGVGAVDVVAKGYRGVVAAVDTNAGGVGSHGGEVATQGAHSAAHTHEAGRSVQVALGNVDGIIYGLCACSACKKQSHDAEKNLLHIAICYYCFCVPGTNDKNLLIVPRPKRLR